MRSVLLLLIQLSKSSKELLQDISTFLLLGKSTLTKEFTTTPLLNSLLKEISEMVELISLLTEPAQSISNLPEIPLMSSNISKKMEIFESLAKLPPLLRLIYLSQDLNNLFILHPTLFSPLPLINIIVYLSISDIVLLSIIS